MRNLSDGEVLETISGLPIPVDKLPKRDWEVHSVNLKDNKRISEEMRSFYKKGLFIVQCEHELEECI